ncbi:hypothetical protein KFZ70_01490 [Tamlana fucoidanivorans]|uniref:Uncharacterized protein n=1 Tax=Allotamlana fucoidanivorans TaxID=2583814 RepID=A0A5C4SLW5_9FLAO|nr:hypothetical protein [Tamlana fucoidanivorans]TNJ44682.1 hypothetical protein FGF67_08555 [Tamlana fucoidanivorans]
MKRLEQFIVFCLLSVYCYAQDTALMADKCLVLSTSKNTLNFNQEFSVYKTLKICAEPQFGDLFNNSFKQILGIANLNQFYNRFDLGVNLGLVHNFQKHIKVKGLCNFGMLRFKNYEANKPENYMVKVSLSYIF